jgi:hypothetical protein
MDSNYYEPFINIENKLDMHCNKNTYYVDLKKLLELIDCENPYNMCSDSMIQKFIDNKNFVNCKKSFHKGKKDTPSNHARIIASLVKLLKNNVNIDKIHVLFIHEEDEYKKKKTYIEVDDGYHRLRAYKFLKLKYIPINYDAINSYMDN